MPARQGKGYGYGTENSLLCGVGFSPGNNNVAAVSSPVVSPRNYCAMLPTTGPTGLRSDSDAHAKQSVSLPQLYEVEQAASRFLPCWVRIRANSRHCAKSRIVELYHANDSIFEHLWAIEYQDNVSHNCTPTHGPLSYIPSERLRVLSIAIVNGGVGNHS